MSSYNEGVPLNGGIMLDLKRMRRWKVNEQVNRVTIEAGVKWGEVWSYLKPFGFAPPLMISLPPYGSFVGPWQKGTATFEPGQPMYPETDSMLCTSCTGIEVVLPTAEVLRTGTLLKPKVVNPWIIPGPNLTYLFLGSHGALGVITRMDLKLYPLPEKHHDKKEILWCYFEDVEDAARADLRVKAGKFTTSRLRYVEYRRVKGQYKPLMVIILIGPEEAMESQKEEIAKIVEENHGKLGEMPTAQSEAILGFPYPLHAGHFWDRYPGPTHIHCRDSMTPEGRPRLRCHMKGGWLKEDESVSDYLERGEAKMRKYGLEPAGTGRFICTDLCFTWGLMADMGNIDVDTSDPDQVRRAALYEEELIRDRFDSDSAHYRWYYGMRNEMEKLGMNFEFLKRMKKWIDPDNIMSPGVLSLPHR